MKSDEVNFLNDPMAKIIEVKYWVESVEQACRITRTANEILSTRFEKGIELAFDVELEEANIAKVSLPLDSFVETFGRSIAFPMSYETGDDYYPIFCLRLPALDVVRTAIRKAYSRRNEK